MSVRSKLSNTIRNILNGKELQKDTFLLVDFDIPIENNHKHHVRAIAQVVWNKKIDKKIVIGARLVTLDSEDREIIKKFVIKSQKVRRDEV